MKWCGAFGVALVLHAVVFWGLLPQTFLPPLEQPASTRVVLISLPSLEPNPVVKARTSESPPEVVDSPTSLVAEASLVEMKKNEPEREPAKLESERELEPEREQELEVERPIADEPVLEEKAVPFDDSVLAAEGHADVDGFFDVPPRARQAIEPNYPFEARRKKHEGDVLCEALITKRGRVETAHVVSSSGYQELDGAALAALRRARFEPATLRGRSVKATVRITIVFRLTGR